MDLSLRPYFLLHYHPLFVHNVKLEFSRMKSSSHRQSLVSIYFESVKPHYYPVELFRSLFPEN